MIYSLVRFLEVLSRVFHIWCFKFQKYENLKSCSPTITPKPLIGSSNYLAWAFLVKLWCKEKDDRNHLRKKDKEIEKKTIAKWEKIDLVVIYASSTSELVLFLLSKTPINHRWVFAVKVGLNGQVGQVKVHLCYQKSILEYLGSNIMIVFTCGCNSMWLPLFVIKLSHID